MNIGIDIDDTIANTYDVLFNYAQNYTINDIGKEIKDVNRNIITHMYCTNFHNWNKKEDKEFLDKYYEKTVLKVQPKMYAVENIKRLKESGDKIYLITARFLSDKFDVEKLTKDWLEKYGIPYDKLILNSQNKVIAAKENDIDIFVDDSIKNCTEMANVGIKTYMMDTIINKDFESEDIERVYSWPHLYQKIEIIKKIKKRRINAWRLQN